MNRDQAKKIIDDLEDKLCRGVTVVPQDICDALQDLRHVLSTDKPPLKFASVVIGNEFLEIGQIAVFEADSEEEAIKRFEFENMAASRFVHPEGNPHRAWILMADYDDGESNMFLFPVVDALEPFTKIGDLG